jgi:hypothetical protein
LALDSVSAWYPGASNLTMNIGSNSLTKLRLNCVSLDCFRHRNYINLVELSYSHDQALSSKTLDFPTLRRLKIFLYWGLLASIRAPNIEVVELREGDSSTYNWTVHKLSMEDLPCQVLYLHLSQGAAQATFINILNTLSIPTLVDLRLE